MSFCEKCGATVQDGERFCQACSTADAKPEAPATESVTVTPPPVTVTPPTVTVTPSVQPAAEKKEENSLGFGAYFGFIILYMIPVIGFIACLILSFAGKNTARKNFSKGFLLYHIVSAIFSVIVVSVIAMFVTALLNSLYAYLGTAMGEIGSIFDVISEIFVVISELIAAMG